MVTVEVNLKEGDEQPEQHLEEGEHIERVVVPLDQLYEKLNGKYCVACSSLPGLSSDRALALSKEDGKIVDAR